MTKEVFKKIKLLDSYKGLIKNIKNDTIKCIKYFILVVVNIFSVISLTIILPIYPIIYFIIKNWILLTWDSQQKKHQKKVSEHMDRQFGQTQRSNKDE